MNFKSEARCFYVQHSCVVELAQAIEQFSDCEIEQDYENELTSYLFKDSSSITINNNSASFKD